MTKGILRQASVAGAIAAGAILAASGTANAVAPDADDMTSVGNNGLGNGSQVLAPIQAPINLCGNSVAVLGVSGAGCDGGSAAQMEAANTGDMTSAGNNGLANGTQADIPVQAPIDVCGNSVGVLGVSGAGCDGGSAAQMSSTESSTTEAGDMTSAGNNGLANGTQADIPVQAPIDVCGNSVGVLGVSGAGCDGGSAAQMEAGDTGDMTSAGNNGLLNGTQVQAPIQVPVDVSGNSVGVLGVSGAGSTGGSAADMAMSWLEE